MCDFVSLNDTSTQLNTGIAYGEWAPWNKGGKKTKMEKKNWISH